MSKLDITLVSKLDITLVSNLDITLESKLDITLVSKHMSVKSNVKKDKYSGTSVDIIKQQLCLFSLYYFSILILNRIHLILSFCIFSVMLRF